MSARQKDISSTLVEKCLSGDNSSYQKLYDLYSKAMYNVCYRIVNDEDEANDVLQEGFVSAFTNLSGFKGESTFGAWLKRIMINKALSQVKKKKPELQSLNELKDDIEYENETKEYEHEYDIKQVREAIDRLPDGYRIVFSLYLLEGYDHAEISQILNISESTSKTQYHRAKNKLKEILKATHYGKER